jgi:hypothetical protein
VFRNGGFSPELCPITALFYKEMHFLQRSAFCCGITNSAIYFDFFAFFVARPAESSASSASGLRFLFFDFLLFSLPPSESLRFDFAFPRSRSGGALPLQRQEISDQ